MPVTHWLILRNPDGTNPRLLAQNPATTDPTKGSFSELVYTNVINGFGSCRFTVNGNHLAAANLTAFSQVEVWRAWPEMSIAPYRDWSGLALDEQASVDVSRGDLYTLTAYSDVYWLSMRAVAFPAGTSNRSSFSSAKGETIMKTLVSYNAGANALAANGRDEDAVVTGLTVQADGATGNSLDWNCANENLLGTLQKLAPGAGGDFDLIKTGAQAWDFRWYIGQRGTDRTATVRFSLELGNMGNPNYQNIRSGERTVALVKGTGTGSDRAVAVRQGANYSTTNKAEMYVNAAGYATTTNALNAAGDAALKASQAHETITFDALPFPVNVYARDWFLGDKVTTKYKSHTLTPRVVMVTVKPDPNAGEIVTPTVAVNV